MKLLLSILFILASLFSGAATYHLAANGNDANDGITSAWQNLSKASAATAAMNWGDSLVLNRGDVFTGSLQISKSGIHIGAYGTGNLPVINGFTTFSIWASVGGGVYESLCPNCRETQHILTVNGVNTGMGRYPNYGYRTISGTASYLVDNTLTASPDWTGATLVQRAADWLIDLGTITKHSVDTLYFASYTTQHNAIGGNGYFIQNDPRTLDTMGEWFYDKTSKKIQMYFGGQSPSNYSVRTSVVDTLLSIYNLSDITIDNISFIGSNLISTSLYGASNVKISNCSYNFSGVDAIYARNAPAGAHGNISIVNTSINNTNNNGVNLENKYGNSILRYDTINNTSLVVGMGKGDDNAGQGVVLSGRKSLFEYSRIINTGYIAFRFSLDSNLIQNNFIDSFCLDKYDGGGMYTFYGSGVTPSQHGTRIINNIILHGSKKPLYGTAGQFAGNELIYPAYGIYIDNGSSGIEISGNMVADCAGSAVFVHASKDINIYNNNFYRNGGTRTGQFSFTPGAYTGGEVQNIVFKKNTLYIENGQKFTYNYGGSIAGIGIIDSNYLVNPFNSLNTYLENTTLADWRTTYSYDLNSTVSTKISTASIFPYNNNSQLKAVWLDGTYYDGKGKAYSNTIYVNPYSSLILMKLNNPIKLKGTKITIKR